MKKIIMVSIVLILILLLCENFSIVPSTAQDSPQAFVGSTERVSISSEGQQGNYSSIKPTISADGRFVEFESWASNLVEGDTNSTSDVFVYDRVAGEIMRATVSSDGTQANDWSADSSISGDGRYVLYTSFATNLVAEDTNEHGDVFLHDRETGLTSRVSVASDATQGNDYSYANSISGDGRYVAFGSLASNLVNGDTNDTFDVFVHDRVSGKTTRVSVSSNGAEGNNASLWASISNDGNHVAFISAATNLVAGDTNNQYDVFVHDMLTGVTALASVASDGTQANNGSYDNSISEDGRYVAFVSTATNLVVSDMNAQANIFVHDMLTGETTLVSVSSDGIQANDNSIGASIAKDGRHVVFDSWASNLVIEDTNSAVDIFMHDQLTGETTRISVASDGMQGNDNSSNPAVSVDGRYVAFGSVSSNLVVGDTNNDSDTFVRDMESLVTSYSITGNCSNYDGSPLPGVNISAGGGYSAITDSQGDYTLSGLQSGTYRITTSLSGYFFIPIYRETSVPPARLGVDFSVGFPYFFPIINHQVIAGKR